MNSIATLDLAMEMVCNIYIALAVFLFVCCWAAIPLTVLFTGFRISQLRDVQFDHRVTTPSHAALHFFFACFFGLLLPTFYFLAVRQRWELGPWYLGRDTHSVWTLTLGVLCMGWLVAHFIEAALRLDRPRFGPSPVNRLMAGLGVGLCLWHITHVAVALPLSPGIGEINIPDRFWQAAITVAFFHLYPLGCFLATMAVFALALVETFRPQPLPRGRHWVAAITVALVLQAALFAPFWLSIPRVTHREAIAMLEEHRSAILTISRQADLDPRLLAGIVCVAQTRDHPRLLGEPFERLALRIWANLSGDSMPMNIDMAPLNPSAGLCQIRPTTAIQILGIMESAGLFQSTARFGKVTSGVSGGTLPWNWQRVLQRESFGPSHLSPLLLQGQPALWPLTQRVVEPALRGDLDALLLESDRSLALAAVMVWTLRQQWRAAGHPIDDRPEILATLYNIGFERSQPKPNPQANDFGRRVLAFMESEDCKALFPTQTEPLQEAAP